MTRRLLILSLMSVMVLISFAESKYDNKAVMCVGTSLVNDVRDVKGKVGDYVRLVKAFKVFPVIDLRVTYRIF